MDRLGRADLHMHTTLSDGIANVQTMLDHAARYCELDVIAITDHDCLDASLWAYAQQGRYPFEIIPGVEVTTAAGHVLALWVTQPIPPNLSLRETADAIHAQDGVAILAHPFEMLISAQAAMRYFRQPKVLIQSEMNAVEIFNAGAFTPGCNWLAKRIFSRIDIPVTGSSDSHMPETIASGVTRFPGRTAADLRTALQRGETLAEGTPWSVTTYLKLLHTRVQKKQNESLETKLPYIRPTQT